MIWRIKRLFWNIKRLIKWVPVIWNNFDFDWVYLIKVMQTKLKTMEEFYANDRITMSVGAKKHAKNIKICRILCDRLITDEYTDCLGLEFGPELIGSLQSQSCNIGICSDWLHYGDYMQKQDLKYLCETLQKHLFNWWD